MGFLIWLKIAWVGIAKMDKFPVNANSIVAYIVSVFATVKGVVSDIDLVTLIGITIGVVTLLVNWYYKHQQHKRDEIRLKMQQGEDVISDS